MQNNWGVPYTLHWFYVLLVNPISVSSFAVLEFKIFKIYIDKYFVL